MIHDGITDCDEFAFLSAEADAVGVTWDESERPTRVNAELADGRQISAIRWGAGATPLTLLHGGTQNAHTWDALAIAVDLPAIAVDLPGHGRSDWRNDATYDPQALGDDVGETLTSLDVASTVLVGMSMGGLVAVSLAARWRELVRALVLVDITPAPRSTRDRIDDFFGRRSFGSFEELVEHAASLTGRADDAARRAAWHNARRRPDGHWEWRHHVAHGANVIDLHERLAEDLAGLDIPVMLVRGRRSRIVTDEHVVHFLQCQPDARVELIADAGHSVQRSHPRRLAELICQFTKGS